MEKNLRGVEKLTVTEIPIEKLTPNPWNPNRMSDEMRAKLTAYIQREGFVEPLVVRPLDDGHQILGGFHRWRIAQDLGYRTVPCVVVDLDDRRAKILSINLNEMKGQSLPSLLGALVHDLSRDLSLEDLETQLPYTLEELKDSLELLKIPDGLASFLDAEAAKHGRERPTILTFVVDDPDVVENAIEAVKVKNGIGTRGNALVELARNYLDGEVVA
jgi:ParB/RepB/Spo0J family partition protein